MIENERGYNMVRQATLEDVLSTIHSHRDELARLVPVKPVCFSPHGNKVHVSVLPTEGKKVPRKVELKLDGDFVIIPFEAGEDYFEYRPFDDS